MPPLWAIAGGVWLLSSVVVALLILWDHARRAPTLPISYELVMVVLGPITLVLAWIFSREEADEL